MTFSLPDTEKFADFTVFEKLTAVVA